MESKRLKPLKSGTPAVDAKAPVAGDVVSMTP